MIIVIIPHHHHHCHCWSDLVSSKAGKDNYPILLLSAPRPARICWTFFFFFFWLTMVHMLQGAPRPTRICWTARSIARRKWIQKISSVLPGLQEYAELRDFVQPVSPTHLLLVRRGTCLDLIQHWSSHNCSFVQIRQLIQQQQNILWYMTHADADAVTPSSNTRSYTRRIVQSSSGW